MRSTITSVAALAAALTLGACVSTPELSGTTGAPSFAALQQMCGGAAVDYGDDAQSVYTTLFDAYVANRRGRLPQNDFCAFQKGLADQYTSLGASRDPASRARWAAYFNDQRAKALSWRASADPTLRAG